MAYVIYIRTEGDIAVAVNALSRIKRRVPAMVREGLREWGETLELDMKEAAISAGIQNSTGELLGPGIQWRQGPRSDWGGLFMRMYGIYLDSMYPHFVNITQRRTRLLFWAQMAQNQTIKAKAEMVAAGKLPSASLYVRPHPFIASGYQRARPKLTAINKRSLRRAIYAS